MDQPTLADHLNYFGIHELAELGSGYQSLGSYTVALKRIAHSAHQNLLPHNFATAWSNPFNYSPSCSY